MLVVRGGVGQALKLAFIEIPVSYQMNQRNVHQLIPQGRVRVAEPLWP